MKSDTFTRELSTISDRSIQTFTKTALNLLPDYFYTVAASSTGKYHPAYALGYGGLVRHTKAAARFAAHLLSLEQYKLQFSTVERDCAIAAILLHDGWKHGKTGHGYTIHEHPQVCADWVRSDSQLSNLVSQEIRDLIAAAIASHMGEWNDNSRSSVILEKPVTELQKFVHMCDYLASRKDIEVAFSDEPEAAAAAAKADTLEDYVMTFGKYRGQLLIDVFKTNRGYVEWMQGNMSLREPLKTFVAQLLS